MTQVSLRVHLGRVQIPEALSRGYLFPVIHWLQECEGMERDSMSDEGCRLFFTHSQDFWLMFNDGTKFSSLYVLWYFLYLTKL